jgi:hypothetical protein
MDSHGFKHLSGCSFGRDEHCTISEMFSESWKNKLQENAFDNIWDPIQKNHRNSQSPKWQILPKLLRSALLVDRHFAELLKEQKLPNYLLKNIEPFFL